MRKPWALFNEDVLPALTYLLIIYPSDSLDVCF